jgi:RNA polymerase sigma-70 factor (ECF subfamily)
VGEDNTFTDFIRRVRAGDERAAAELVQRFEPVVRREVRFRLRDARLQRLFDSMDICQSVLASFFVRAASGQYELDDPGHLLRLLVSMARNKLAFEARKQHAQRRDNRRAAGRPADELEAVAPGDSPSQLVAGKELLHEFRERLTPEERQLADLRGAGCAWADIAVRLGGTPHGRRMQLKRAVERVVRELGLDEAGHD